MEFLIIEVFIVVRKTRAGVVDFSYSESRSLLMRLMASAGYCDQMYCDPISWAKFRRIALSGVRFHDQIFGEKNVFSGRSCKENRSPHCYASPTLGMGRSYRDDDHQFIASGRVYFQLKSLMKKVKFYHPMT